MDSPAVEIKTPDQNKVKAKALPPMTARVPMLKSKKDKIGKKLVKRKMEAKVYATSRNEFYDGDCGLSKVNVR